VTKALTHNPLLRFAMHPGNLTGHSPSKEELFE
jgi:hypothetical protein